MKFVIQQSPTSWSTHEPEDRVEYVQNICGEGYSSRFYWYDGKHSSQNCPFKEKNVFFSQDEGCVVSLKEKLLMLRRKQ